ncbi:MAG TPA: right-handed parallel beta-helix repeat-containing protein, partial [Acidothermaceae bacterium]|nr:right-handed parallel beta-helix repeat-containing protein [Acidothermaceae bacterium]
MDSTGGRWGAGRPGAGWLGAVLGAATVVAGIACVGSGVAGAAVPRGVASATTQLYVTASGSAGGPCSKSHPCNSVGRAVVVANHVAYTFTPVTINVGPGHYLTHLNFPDVPYPEPKLTIVGRSPSATVLTAGGAGSVLTALSTAPTIDVEDLTITGATGSHNGGGGAVHDGGNYMNFLDVTFSHNKALVAPSAGGAVEDDGGVMTVTDSTFVDNTAVATSAGGGALAEQGGTLTVSGSLFSGNTVAGTPTKSGSGGAIYVNVGHLTVTDSTITRNTATGTASGGAIGLDQSSQTRVIGSTISANSASGPGGLVNDAGGAKIGFGGDILVANLGAAGSVCSAEAGGKVEDLGYNVIDQPSCQVGSTTKLASASAVGLLPLARNGGPTRTERIKKSSAAHDVVPVTAKIAGRLFCSGNDQRGVPRRQGPAHKCDAGSYQFAPPVIT